MENKIIDSVITDEVMEHLEENDYELPTPSKEEIEAQLESIKETEEDYRSAVSFYDLTDNEVTEFIKLMDDFRKNKDMTGAFDRLPATLQRTALALGSIAKEEVGHRVSKDNCAKLLLNEFIHDAKYEKLMNDYQQEMQDTIKEMNEGYANIINEAFDDTFAKIDQIKAEDPEKAEIIQKVKKAFDTATTFERQKEYLKKFNGKKLGKLADRMVGETIYFNKKVNKESTGVVVPDINELWDVIRMTSIGLGKAYDNLTISKFIVLICKSCEKLDVEANIYDLAYVYKMIDSIYRYKFAPLDENGEKIFNNIFEVLDLIQEV